jgi:hypothetical protein
MNELNKEMKKIAESYIKKNNLEVLGEQYGEYYYIAILKDNDKGIKQLNLNVSCNCRTNNVDYIYMKADNGKKQKRIPKNEW